MGFSFILATGPEDEIAQGFKKRDFAFENWDGFATIVQTLRLVSMDTNRVFKNDRQNQQLAFFWPKLDRNLKCTSERFSCVASEFESSDHEIASQI